jgi:hypothetical protein
MVTPKNVLSGTRRKTHENLKYDREEKLCEPEKNMRQ